MNRVCHITSKHPVFDSRIFYKQCISLSNNNYEVFLLAKNYKDEIVDNIKIVSLNSARYRIFNLFYISIYQVFKHSIKIKAQIYHFHDPDLIIVCLILKLFGKKVIYDVHEDYEKSIKTKPYLKSKTIRKIISKSFNIFEKFFSKFFNGLILATPEISKRFNVKNKIEIRNYPLINIEKISEKKLIKKGIIKLVYVGGISVIRGIFNMLNLLKYIDNAELILLGKFESESLYDLCKKHEAWDKVCYYGHLQYNDMYNKIKEADVGLILLHKVPNYENSLPTKAFDYMSCGVPFIMSAFDYWEDFFNDSAIFVDNNDYLNIIEEIYKLYNNTELYENISSKNVLKIKNIYNWNIEETKLLEFYNNIL